MQSLAFVNKFEQTLRRSLNVEHKFVLIVGDMHWQLQEGDVVYLFDMCLNSMSLLTGAHLKMQQMLLNS